MTTLPPPLAATLQPLFDALPLDRAMTALVVTSPLGGAAADAAKQLAGAPPFAASAPLAAGLWLCVDDLDASHRLSQRDESDPTHAFWHGIMHRREGDFSNSHYWFRRVGQHPAIALIDGYDPHRFIDEAEAAHGKGSAPPPEALIDLQRREWVTLMAWCAKKI